MDNGSIFAGNEWKQLSGENGVVLKFCSNEDHNGMSLGEKYHVLMKNVFEK